MTTTTLNKQAPAKATMKHPPFTDAEWDRIEAKQAERMKKLNRLCHKSKNTIEAGMRLAIETMKLLREEAAGDLTSAEQTYGDFLKPDETRYYRRGPQSKLLWRVLDELAIMFPQARTGFALVMTDYLGQVLSGSVPDPEFYEKEFNTLQRWKLNDRGDPV